MVKIKVKHIKSEQRWTIKKCLFDIQNDFFKKHFTIRRIKL